jgi:hypothetical protein
MAVTIAHARWLARQPARCATETRAPRRLDQTSTPEVEMQCEGRCRDAARAETMKRRLWFARLGGRWSIPAFKCLPN